MVHFRPCGLLHRALSHYQNTHPQLSESSFFPERYYVLRVAPTATSVRTDAIPVADTRATAIRLAAEYRLSYHLR